MTHPWYKFYPAGVKPKIDISSWTSIASVLEKACEKYADKTALTCLGADLSYRDLNKYADNLAAYMQKTVGIQKGDRVAIMLPNVMQFPIAFIALQKIGAVCVNTNPLYTPREMKHQFVDSGTKAIIIIDLFANNLEKILTETGIKHVIITSIGDQLPAWKGLLIKTVMKLKGLIPAHNLTVTPFKTALAEGAKLTYNRPKIEQDDIAVLQYTGGTTGLSKGAMLLQKNILANMAQIQNCARAIVDDGEETVLTALPLYHIFALAVNFLSFLAMGQRMVLVPKPVPIENTVKIFKKYKITVMTGVNTLFNSLANNPEFQANPAKSLKIALGGGMAVQEAVQKKWRALTGKSILEGFGLTEASPVTHINPSESLIRTNSIGIPVASTESKVVDEQGNEVAIGETGELLVKGPQVMAGYWQKPEETAKSIRNGWLWTGDMARMDNDGYFYIVDRKKDMILVSGFNVYPNEVEEVLALHPKVLEAAVVGIKDEESGESVKAFVVAKDPSLTVEELKEHCKEQLTGYKRPKHIEFKKDLPKTNVGKILRRELRDSTEQKAKN